MIQIVDGKGVGAGKSYYVARHCVRHIAHGGTVVITEQFRLKPEQIRTYLDQEYGLEMQDDQIRVVSAEETWRLHEVTPPGTDDNPVLIILDEAQNQLNARDWNDPKKRGLFLWCCESRHDNNDLIFITQNAANIDKQIQRLCTYIVRTRNMCNFHIPGLFRWPFKQFLVKTFDADGRTHLKTEWLKHDKRIFACYESKCMRGHHKRTGEPIGRKHLKRTKKKASPMLKFLAVFALLGIVWGGFKVGGVVLDMLSGKKTGAAAMVSAPSSSTNSPAPSLSAAAVKQVEPRKPMWTIKEEQFRGFTAGMLSTSEGVYFVGEMSRHGMVEQIRGKVARITSPTGDLVYVVAADRPEPRAPVAQVPQASTPAPVATYKPAVLTQGQRIQGGYARTDADQEENLSRLGGYPVAQADHPKTTTPR